MSIMIKRLLSLTLLFCYGTYMNAMDGDNTEKFRSIDVELCKAVIENKPIKEITSIINRGGDPSSPISESSITTLSIITTLHLASLTKPLPVVNLLIKKCSEVDIEGHFGYTPLFLFIMRTRGLEDNHSIIKDFLYTIDTFRKKNANFQKKDKWERQIVHVLFSSIRFRKVPIKIMEKIIDCNVNLNAKNRNGDTVCHLIAKQIIKNLGNDPEKIENVEKIKNVFLQLKKKSNKLNFNLENDENLTPYDIATSSTSCPKVLSDLFLPQST